MLQLKSQWVRALSAVSLAAAAMLSPVNLHAQNASISGTVLAEGTERPVAGVEIAVSGINRTVHTDSAGTFTIAGLAAGKYSLTMRLVGFEQLASEITVKAAQAFEADFLMKPGATVLKDVDVKAKAPAGPYAVKLAEFESRRQGKSGKFLTAEDFEKAGGRAASTLLAQKLAGLRIVQSNGRRILVSSRGTGLRAGGGTTALGEKLPPGCYMQIILNGRVEYNGAIGQQMFDVDALNTEDIIGVEYYSTATTPLQYNATRGSEGNACGTVIFWTKGG